MSPGQRHIRQHSISILSALNPGFELVLADVDPLEVLVVGVALAVGAARVPVEATCQNTTTLAVEMVPSLAPSTAARSQPT